MKNFTESTQRIWNIIKAMVQDEDEQISFRQIPKDTDTGISYDALSPTEDILRFDRDKRKTLEQIRKDLNTMIEGNTKLSIYYCPDNYLLSIEQWTEEAEEAEDMAEDRIEEDGAQIYFFKD